MSESPTPPRKRPNILRPTQEPITSSVPAPAPPGIQGARPASSLPADPAAIRRDQATREAQHAAAAASSPLAVSFQLIGCAFATTDYGNVAGEIPEYHFHPPCPFGKARPDQDCRTCSYVQIIPVGSDQRRAAFRHRYHGHGLVIPITDDVADKLVDVLAGEGCVPLARPAWQDYFAQREQDALLQQEREQRARDLELRQSGRE